MLLEKSLQFAMANHAKPAPLPPSLPEPPVSPRKDAQKEKELKSMQEMISQAKLKPAQAVNAGSPPPCQFCAHKYVQVEPSSFSTQQANDLQSLLVASMKTFRERLREDEVVEDSCDSSLSEWDD